MGTEIVPGSWQIDQRIRVKETDTDWTPCQGSVGVVLFFDDSEDNALNTRVLLDGEVDDRWYNDKELEAE